MNRKKYKTLFLQFTFLFICFLADCLAGTIPPETRLQEAIHFQENATNVIGYIAIDDRSSAISEATWLYVKQALNYYKQRKPIFIILELNTPGGEVFAAQKISNALKEIDTQYNIPVVAFVNNWAISAGAMLAYSSRFIATTKDGSMGAAAPVIASNTGEMQEASEKVNSAIRAEFANLARFYDRNPYLAEGMVDKDIVLVMRNGEIIKLDSESEIIKGATPDRLIKPKGKLLTLNAQQMMEYGVADLLVSPVKLEPITPEEKSAGRWPASKSLLFQNPFFAKISHAEIDAYQMDWKTRFFVILASPMVSSILILGLMMGMYMEFSTPGFGVAGSVAVICLFLIVLSYLSLEIASWLEVILMFSGIAILLIDFFVLPTFGLIGIFGLLLFLGGLFGMMLPAWNSISFDFDTNTLNAAGEYFMQRLAWLSATLVLGFLLILFVSRFVTPHVAKWSKLVLVGSEQEASKGFIAGEYASNLPRAGDQGEVLATLRPAGKIIVDNKIFDAITEGSYIEKGASIQVARLDGSVIIVEQVRDHST